MTCFLFSLGGCTFGLVSVGVPVAVHLFNRDSNPFIHCSRRVLPGCENLLDKEECALPLQQRIAPHRVFEWRIDFFHLLMSTHEKC